MTFQITLDEKRKTGKSLSTNCYTANTLLIRTLVFSVNCGESFFLPPSAPLFKAVAVTYCDGFSFLFRAVAKRGEKAPFGPECAKPCLCAGAFTLKIGSALCLARHRQMTLPPSAPSHSAKRPILHRQAFPSPFRYVCPELYRKQGKAELHWSLQTL